MLEIYNNGAVSSLPYATMDPLILILKARFFEVIVASKFFWPASLGSEHSFA